MLPRKDYLFLYSIMTVGIFVAVIGLDSPKTDDQIILTSVGSILIIFTQFTVYKVEEKKVM
jgi:hypothetical protein